MNLGLDALSNLGILLGILYGVGFPLLSGSACR